MKLWYKKHRGTHVAVRPRTNCPRNEQEPPSQPTGLWSPGARSSPPGVVIFVTPAERTKANKGESRRPRTLRIGSWGEGPRANSSQSQVEGGAKGCSPTWKPVFRFPQEKETPARRHPWTHVGRECAWSIPTSCGSLECSSRRNLSLSSKAYSYPGVTKSKVFRTHLTFGDETYSQEASSLKQSTAGILIHLQCRTHD